MMTDWLCIDCGTDTAPGLALSGAELAYALVLKKPVTVSAESEIYFIKSRVRKAAGTSARLCVGCLEKRLGRQLHRDDFVPGQVFNELPATARLVSRREAPNPNPSPITKEMIEKHKRSDPPRWNLSNSRPEDFYSKQTK